MDKRIQIEPYSLTQYINAGCEILTRNGRLDSTGAYIYSATGGKPCNGCCAYNRCAARAKLRGVEKAQETVREEAERRGLSIGEVRRQRKANIGTA